ncbi:ABC transporter ATP-binding protein [Arthrobacter sp. efr-133-TYG-118]|uniref:ABC transporter ATP-binding protein n=1 Tax=Arthrobacter sp. efr-133-TYG-118 TaxID=3040279 RepID=UPI002550DA8C|nr:ABC transporter ATP-binding protein [Arthrobacter sp. efr-133-TYG-118]
MSATGISLDRVEKTFPLKKRYTYTALKDVTLEVGQGEFLALLGPSGCGKSTILRMIAGLEQPSAGSLAVNGRGPQELVNEHRLGVAFQDHALLPWLTVYQNVSLPYQLAKRPVDSARIQELLELVGLADFRDAHPRQLSGGMRQRASIARSLILKPDVLLLDEPFGALDAVTRRRMNLELARIWDEERTTTVLVTHDVEEAVFLAQRVVVLAANPGRVRHDEVLSFDTARTEGLERTAEFHHVVDRLTRMLDAS